MGNISRLKNLVIIFLILTAIYLTGQLWFEKFSNRNFYTAVMSYFVKNETSNEQIITHIIKPYRNVVNVKDTYVFYNRDENTAGNEIILLALKKGEYGGTEQRKIKDFVNSRFYMLEYSFNMPMDFFCEVSGNKTSPALSKIKNFDKIMIVPEEDKYTLNVYFIEEETKNFHLYKIVDEELLQRLNDNMNSVAANSLVRYALIDEEDEAAVKDYTFVPQWDHATLSYNVVKTANPYAPKGDLIVTDIEQQVEYLFKYQDFQFRPADGIYTFSNENTVVRYYPNNVLEYADYSLNNDKNVIYSAASNYFVALNFLERDENIINNYYLAGMDINEKSKTFYFGYTMNLYPIKMSETIISDINMGSPIKIEIENNRVTKYKKLAYNFILENDYYENATVNFENTLNSIFPKNSGKTEIKAGNICLAYRMEKNKNLRLYWFMDINGASNVFPAQFNPG